MSYEDAFQALTDNDLPRAVLLLEKAARETGYSSDIINHAYTLALYRVGDMQRLADVAFQVGNSLSSHDRASAMDYFQRALIAGLDAGRANQIGQMFEQWAAPAREKSGRLPAGAIKHVAHVIGCLLPNHIPTQYLKMLVSSLGKQGIRSSVFTTEWATSWFFNPAGEAQSQLSEVEADIHIAAVDGDFEERASRVAEALRKSGVTCALFHGGLNQQIMARVASMRPTAVQINVGMDAEMDADLFDGRIHLSENAMRRTRFSGPAERIPPVTDIEFKLQMSEPVTRQSMGIESASSISATFGALQYSTGREYLGGLVEILQRFPKHFHLFAGAGNVRSIRSLLHGEGVLPRVRFLGQIGDIAPLLDLIDIYLASFPDCDSNSVLDVMGAGKPPVTVRSSADSPQNAAAEFVAVSELVATSVAGYIDIADRLLRNPAFRAQQGRSVKDRFRAEFAPEHLGVRYKTFLETFCDG